MNVNEFIEQCERTFGSGKVKLIPAQHAVYHEKLRRFTQSELSAIYDKVLESTEHFPKIKNIYDAARELGYLQTEHTDFRPHRWQSSDCNLCYGEGRLCVTWILTAETQNGNRVLVEALNKIVPYGLSCDSDKFKLQDNEYRSLWRCLCMAGEAATLPKTWPKWSRNMSPLRYLR